MANPKLAQYRVDPMKFFEDLVIPSALGPKRFGGCMTDFQADTFRILSPCLLAVANGDKPPIGKHWIERSKGSSKDSDLTCALLWLLAFGKQPLTMQIAAADKDQAGEMLKCARDILRLNPWLSARIECLAWKLLCKATNSECEILATDIHGSHGARPDVLVANELSHVVKREAIENLMDNATKKPNGLVLIASNAGQVDSWQYGWRKIAENSDRWKMHVYSQPAEWMAPEDLAEAEHRNSRSRFHRLYYG